MCFQRQLSIYLAVPSSVQVELASVVSCITYIMLITLTRSDTLLIVSLTRSQNVSAGWILQLNFYEALIPDRWLFGLTNLRHWRERWSWQGSCQTFFSFERQKGCQCRAHHRQRWSSQSRDRGAIKACCKGHRGIEARLFELCLMQGFYSQGCQAGPRRFCSPERWGCY